VNSLVPCIDFNLQLPTHVCAGLGEAASRSPSRVFHCPVDEAHLFRKRFALLIHWALAIPDCGQDGGADQPA